MDRNLIPTYVARDLLMPLDECFERSGFDSSLYYEPTISEVTVDDQIYAVPEAMDTRNWLVNTAAFEEAGLDVDDFDFSDWDAIRSANDALLAREGDALIPRSPSSSPSGPRPTASTSSAPTGGRRSSRIRRSRKRSSSL
jgi:multiple sugar transport system substrate-binding protein